MIGRVKWCGGGEVWSVVERAGVTWVSDDCVGVVLGSQSCVLELRYALKWSHVVLQR